MFSHPSLLEWEFLVQGESKCGGWFVRKYISKRRCPTLLFKFKEKNPEMTLKYSSSAKSRENKNKGHTVSTRVLSES